MLDILEFWDSRARNVLLLSLVQLQLKPNKRLELIEFNFLRLTAFINKLQTLNKNIALYPFDDLV